MSIITLQCEWLGASTLWRKLLRKDLLEHFSKTFNLSTTIYRPIAETPCVSAIGVHIFSTYTKRLGKHDIENHLHSENKVK